MMAEIWTFVGWLTHSKSSTWHDAEMAITTTEHVISICASVVMRHIREVPDECPECGSPHLSPQDGWLEELPEVAWQRPICDDCGWEGKPVPVGDRDFDPNEFELITREGGEDTGKCIVPDEPLRKLKRPSDGD